MSINTFRMTQDLFVWFNGLSAYDLMSEQDIYWFIREEGRLVKKEILNKGINFSEAEFTYQVQDRQFIIMQPVVHHGDKSATELGYKYDYLVMVVEQDEENE